MTVQPDSADELPMPAPDSLHWRYGGDNRIYFLLVRTGVLQLMLPALGAGVEFHSNFFREPWERILRSTPQIQGTVFDWPDSGHTARTIRDYHRDIKGVDAQGRRYHALDPETYFWAHATIFDALLKSIELFREPLSDQEKEQLYTEARAIYRGYGVSERVVPPDYSSFRVYFERVCAQQLEATKSALATVKFSRVPPSTFPLVPAPLYRLGRVPVAWLLWWITVATLPQSVRDKLGQRWSRWDDRWFRLFRVVVRLAWPLLPYRVRLSKRARDGYARVGCSPDGFGPRPRC